MSDNYLNHDRSLKSWMFTLDHKRIGLLYMGAVLTMFALGGLFAIFVRTFLWEPNRNSPGAMDFYNHSFTLHGTVMVFLFIIPAIPAIMGNFILPLQLGAKDVAFPRLNLMSFYIYVLGALFFTYVLLTGVLHSLTPHAAFWAHFPDGYGLDTGWTFYAPYSTQKAEGAVVAGVMGAFILGFSSILTGVNFIASIHMLRPRGMTWFRMPLFLWAIYATALIQILATPVLAITLLLLACERAFGVGIFTPSLGGDPILMQHFFWFYSHPAVYIMILPAMGVISEIIVTFSRRHIFGYNFIAFSSIAIALLGFLVWGHHMFVSGQSALADVVFSLLTFSVAIPSAVKVFNWLATLYRGDIRLNTPMLYALGFIMLFTIGGLTGLFLGALSVDVFVTGTYFVVAHFHYVMVGSMLFAFIGGMYYWFPKIFGKMYPELPSKFAAVLLFIGFNVTFFPQFIGGAMGMPRRWATYPEQFMPYMRISTVGAYIMGVSLLIVLATWVYALMYGKKAADNPWGGPTLEWATSSPPPHDNFAVAPVAGDPYDLHDLVYDPAIDGWKRVPKSADVLVPQPTH